MAVELCGDKLAGADLHHQIRQELALWSNADTFRLDNVSTRSGTPCVHIFVSGYS